MNQPLTTHDLGQDADRTYTCSSCGRVYDDAAVCSSDDCPSIDSEMPLTPINKAEKKIIIAGVEYSIPAWVSFIAADSDSCWYGYRDHPLCGNMEWYTPMEADYRVFLIVRCVAPDKHWSKTLLAV